MKMRSERKRTDKGIKFTDKTILRSVKNMNERNQRGLDKNIPKERENTERHIMNETKRK